MKKTIMILAAIALMLGLPQCKKQTSGVLEGTVEITLDVSASKGSRIDVAPITGDVAFEYGDVVYVGSGGKFVGTLTCRGSVFKGQITDPTLGEPLYFFFLGNKTPAETLAAGTSTSCSVNISDQTSNKLPVISFATSDQNFTGKGNYTAFFLNKAALVKFDVTTPSFTETTSILGMNNKVTVSFADNSFGYSQDGEGAITLPAGSGERWAILLPQGAVAAAVAQSGDGFCTGTCTIPAISENGYLTEGIEVTLSALYVDLGLPSGLLWAIYNVGADTPEGYGDYFAWGETTTKSNYAWGTYQHCMGSYNKLTKYCQNSSYGYNGFTDDLTTLEPGDDAVVANWGNGWRMPTPAEFEELKNNTTVTWTQQNGVNGCLFTAANGNSLFMPAAGCRYGSTQLNDAGSVGYYWSSSLSTDTPLSALNFNLNSYYCSMGNSARGYNGFTVRPVRNAN